MKAKTTYYAIVGNNGFAVVDEWYRVLKARKYFRGDNCKGYCCKEEAIMAAKMGYNEKHEYTKYYGDIKVNELYFTKNFVSQDMLPTYPIPMVVFNK